MPSSSPSLKIDGRVECGMRDRIAREGGHEDVSVEVEVLREGVNGGG